MTEHKSLESDSEIPVADLFRPVFYYRRPIWQGTLLLTFVAILAGGLYLFLQPKTRSAVLGFRPLFEGADKGKYPNQLAFSPNDIVDSSIVSQVIASNHLEEYCGREQLQAALLVQVTSPGLQFLDLEYQARLSDARLTAVERQRLQDDYVSKRTALPPQYQLMFLQPRECKPIPPQVLYKALDGILQTWAKDSQEKRGVLKLQMGVITPAIFDLANAADEPLLVRADLVRSGMVRVLENISAVERLPGAELIRTGPGRVSLAEVRPRIEDLMLARLDPLIAISGTGLGEESERWVTQAFETATGQLQAAEKRVDTYRQALREYSGLAGLPSTARPSRDGPQTSTDVQALTPQIDRTFIESIVAMSAANTAFRQEITRQVIDASTDAVNKSAVVEHYKTLLASMKSTRGPKVPEQQVNAKLAKIIAEAKEATRLFNEIFDEFSRVSFRADSAMYRVERPAEAFVLRGFTLRDLVILVLGVLFASPLVLAVAYFSLHHVRRFVKSVR